ncbi:ion channel [Rhodopila sp.]|uniref:ion channel n=1 Tax=Rhodopila sp. TaxID=2480087 RepID=UPI003D0C38A5
MTRGDFLSFPCQRIIGDVAIRDHALTALLVLEALTLFVAAPLAGMGIRSPLLIGGMLGIPLALAIVIISPNMGARLLATFATALAFAGAAFRISHPSIQSIWLGHGAAIVAVIAISWVIGQAVFAPGRVTHHRIEGAVILYLNIAVLFTSAYRLVSELDPAGFVDVPAGEPEAAAISGMLYFSFSTLTSTGFGEIRPLHPIARSLANLESVLGQLYLTILLARLVTLHIEARRD